MSDIDDGGPAYPVITTNETVTCGSWASSPGMTLRDWFAAHADISDFTRPDGTTHVPILTALAGEPMPSHGWSGTNSPEQYRAMIRWEAKWMAALRFIRADAALAARKEKPDA